MIIIKAPLRIPIGGGATDVPYYYSQFEGDFISGAINKYVYVAINKRYDSKILLKYSEIEEAENVETIKHNYSQEALKLLGVKNGIEITSFSDLPYGTGLGSSGSFLVALLEGLHMYTKKPTSVYNIAEEACKIQMETLKESSGKQDPFIAAYGGIRHFHINKEGVVTATNLKINDKTLSELEKNCLMFYTGIRRSADEVLKTVKENVKKDATKELECVHRLKEIGYDIKNSLENNNPDKFGELMHVHWETKKKLSDKMSSSQIDKWYETAINSGALGGKIMGAGGGGYFLFYCNKNHKKIKESLKLEGLVETPFKFEISQTSGISIIDA